MHMHKIWTLVFKRHIHLWIERVPSKDNISDSPSRSEYEIMEDESVFKEGVYESLWIKVKTGNHSSKIIGNIYRPNSAPKASIKQAIEIHCSILAKIAKNKSHSKCAIEVVGDFNIDL